MCNAYAESQHLSSDSAVMMQDKLRLTDDNFVSWKRVAPAILFKEGVWKVVNPESSHYAKPEEEMLAMDILCEMIVY